MFKVLRMEGNAILWNFASISETSYSPSHTTSSPKCGATDFREILIVCAPFPTWIPPQTIVSSEIQYTSLALIPISPYLRSAFE